ncbi:MAG: hypothetical protein ABI566_06635 [Pseudolysinimonas sp.]
MSSETSAPPPRRRRWITAAKVAGAIISVVSFVTGIIAIVPILTRDTSNFSSLTVEVSPYPATLTEWALPLTTDFSSFPTSTGEVCTDGQRDWLAQNGQQITTRLLVDFRNTATEGPMLTVKDFRVTGTRDPAAEQRILVECNTAPVSIVQLQAARIDATSDGNIAVYAPDAFGLGEEGIPDIPVTWNVAPGEGGQLILNVASSVAFDGALTATVLSGTESRDQPLAAGATGALAAPPLLALGTLYLQAAGDLQCRELIDSEPVACDLAEVLTRPGS